MRLSHQDIETLKIINEQLNKFKNNGTIRVANENLTILLRNDIDYPNKLEFAKNLHFKIRTPIYEMYSSDEVANLDKATKNVIFNSLMLMAYYWPVNKLCCVSNSVITDRTAYLVSGHRANQVALSELWGRDNNYLHPVYQNRVTTREILLNFPGARVDPNKFSPINQPLLKERIKQETKLPWMLRAILAGLGAALGVSILSFGVATIVFTGAPFLIGVASMVGFTIAAFIISDVSHSFLTNLSLTWLVNRKFNEKIELNHVLKSLLDDSSCDLVEKRNNIFLKLLAHTKSVRGQNLASNLAIALSSNIDNSNPQTSPPRTNWNSVGFHATNATVSMIMPDKSGMKYKHSQQMTK